MRRAAALLALAACGPAHPDRGVALTIEAVTTSAPSLEDVPFGGGAYVTTALSLRTAGGARVELELTERQGGGAQSLSLPASDALLRELAAAWGIAAPRGAAHGIFLLCADQPTDRGGDWRMVQCRVGDAAALGFAWSIAARKASIERVDAADDRAVLAALAQP